MATLKPTKDTPAAKAHKRHFVVKILKSDQNKLAVCPVTKNNGHPKRFRSKMDTNIPPQQFPPNVPPKLIDLFILEKSNYSALARRLKMNKSFVHKLLVDGVEPTNKILRKKLLLPAKIRPPLPPEVQRGVEILRALETKANPPSRLTYRRSGE